METKTRIATIQCAKDYAIHYPWVIRMDSNKHYEPKLNHRGYPSISFRRRRLGIDQKVEVHRALAYQKFGEIIFAPELEVRHRDGDKLNFRAENILIGTPLDNFLDKSESTRAAHVRLMADFSFSRRRFSPEQVEEILADRAVNMGYAALARKYDASKSLIWLLVNGHTYGELTSKVAGPDC